jgi:alpha-glucosidase
MMKKLLVFSVVLNCLLVGNLIFWFRHEIESRLRKHYSIVFYGDSITYNGDWSSFRGNFDVRNSGFPGFTTSHLVWLMNENVIKYKPDTCYLMAGINDIGVGIPLARTQLNYQKIVDSLLRHKIVPVIQSTLYTRTPEENEKVDSLNTFLKSLASKRKTTFIDVNQVLSKDMMLKKELTIDGVHLNKKGYTLWKSLLERPLQKSVHFGL